MKNTSASAQRSHLLELFGLLIILLWSLWVGRAYLNFDPQIWPYGYEFPMTIETHSIWTFLTRCGTCMLWNGMYGGSPALAELHGAVLHPLVILSTLLFGLLNGAKATLIASLFMAGAAQWWLGKVLKVSWLARVWTACAAVAGGHLGGRMELGLFGMVLSTAACSLVLAPALDLALNGRRRSAVWLGVVLALALLSGQGYMQIGLVLGILPPLIFFFWDDTGKLRPIWKEFLLAGLLAVLISAVLWVPVAHFSPQIVKWTDPEFKAVQDIAYIPLNLVINNVQFFKAKALGNTDTPAFYLNYIGWLPVLLALICLRTLPRRKNRLLWYLVTAFLLVLVSAAALPFKLLAPYNSAFTGVRFPTMISGLLVPIVLAAAALGLDGLLPAWRTFLAERLRPRLRSVFIILLLWLPLIAALLATLISEENFSHTWLTSLSSPEADYAVPTSIRPQVISKVLQAIQTSTTQWVLLPDAVHVWVIPALNENLKLSYGLHPFYYKNRTFPPPQIEVTHYPPTYNPSETLLTDGDLYVYRYPQNNYAVVATAQHTVPCAAFANGGNIDVTCATNASGLVQVKENSLDGWHVWVDGKPAQMMPGDWLQVQAQPGTHLYSFRYLPLDVLVGALLSLLGIVLTVLLYRRSGLKTPNPSPSN